MEQSDLNKSFFSSNQSNLKTEKKNRKHQCKMNKNVFKAK